MNDTQSDSPDDSVNELSHSSKRKFGSNYPSKTKTIVLVFIFFIFFVLIYSHYQKNNPQIIDEKTQIILPKSRPSVKVLAYIFPQFHPIPENDKIWGVNFTEWNNVRRVTHNRFGIETIRPTDEVGFYNQLDLSTRKRQAQFLKDSGFYGVVYHHYWFGRPVMDGILQKILEDGEPNIPFMLNWANEPWTARWDGRNDGEVFLAQEYGEEKDWRKHFEWLIPFFKHPLYIRSSEGKLQFVIYEPSYMGSTATKMFAAWRKWAVEEGLGGLDIIETRIPHDTYDRPPADAINEFAWRSGNSFDHADMIKIPRRGQVYYRSTYVCWDNTPRHPNAGWIMPFCHPTTFKLYLLELLRLVKLDPNPVNRDNFLFINALNEWGEGNVLEPSKQFGDGYGVAVRSAIEMSDKLDPWIYELQENGRKLKKELEKSDQKAHVCVLIRAFSKPYPESTPFNLAAMLRSLQGQSNANWKALVFKTQRAEYKDQIEEAVSKTFDPRIKLIDIPTRILAKYTDEDMGYQATDWVIENLDQLDPSCGTARYLVITDSDHTYEETTFEYAAKDFGDIIGINFASRNTFLKQEKEELKWDERCSRFKKFETRLCEPSGVDNLDIGALFIKLDKFRKGEYKFSDFRQKEHVALIEDLIKKGWTWYQDMSTTCHFRRGDTYTSCHTTGRFWVDSPILSETGCFSYRNFFDKFGWDVVPFGEQWDLKHFLERDPFCLRYKEDTYVKKVTEIKK